MIKYFLAVVLSLHCACAYAESRPNVLWIYLEDVSGWLSCYGETLIETPNFDRRRIRQSLHVREPHPTPIAIVPLVHPRSGLALPS